MGIISQPETAPCSANLTVSYIRLLLSCPETPHPPRNSLLDIPPSDSMTPAYNALHPAIPPLLPLIRPIYIPYPSPRRILHRYNSRINNRVKKQGLLSKEATLLRAASLVGEDCER